MFSKNFLTNKYLRFLIPAGIGIVFLILLRKEFGIDKAMTQFRCEEEDKWKQSELIGIVTEIYRDVNNRNIRIMKYLEGDNIVESRIFTYELSDVFEQIEVGDSIVKQKNSLHMSIFRNGELKTENLYYGCEN